MAGKKGKNWQERKEERERIKKEQEIRRERKEKRIVQTDDTDN